MTDLFERILKSDQFTFYVGEVKRPIVVHAAAIAEQSRALNTLINGRMKEAQTRSVDFSEVHEEDFIRLCQFAYTGDYATPSFVIREETSTTSHRVREVDSLPDLEPDEPNAEPLAVLGDLTIDWSVRGSRESKKKDRTRTSSPPKKARLRMSFENKSFCSPLPRQSLMDSCEPIFNSESRQDYTDVFLAHARLYVLADKYGIEPLTSLSLHKLHKTLVGFTLYEARIGDIMELARYAYSEDRTSDYDVDDLRTLVSEYVACEIDTIGKSEEFLSLMEEGGPFTRDFWKLVQQHLL